VSADCVPSDFGASIMKNDPARWEVVMRAMRNIALILFLIMATRTLAAPPPEPRPVLERVGHIIVIFLENRSFDHLYGLFPGADGLNDAGRAADQITPDGQRFDVLPAVLNNYTAAWIDRRFASGLPNEPFREDHFVDLREQTATRCTGSIRNRRRSMTGR
jgi:phospholipase C